MIFDVIDPPSDFGSVLRFRPGTKDLPTVSKKWKSDTFDSRLSKVNEYVYQLKGHYPPSNLIPIREGILPIMGGTTMTMLRRLADDIRDRFGIDCFQIAIDSTSLRASMLFDFFNRDTEKNIVINASQHKMLCAMVVRQLGLPRTFENTSYTGYMLKERYQTDPVVFKKLLFKLNCLRLGYDNHLLVCDVLEYVTQMCQGKVK